MLLSALIIALSMLSIPLALGRPATAPTSNAHHSSPPVEPSALLGRRYNVHEHRDVAHTQAASTTTESALTEQSARHTKPFARYIADRSDDMWVHERRAPLPLPQADAGRGMDDVNYVSHVGPYPYEPPPPPPTSAHTSKGDVPVQNLAAADATAMPVPTPSENVPFKYKKAKAKARAKPHKVGKKARTD